MCWMKISSPQGCVFLHFLYTVLMYTNGTIQHQKSTYMCSVTFEACHMKESKNEQINEKQNGLQIFKMGVKIN